MKHKFAIRKGNKWSMRDGRISWTHDKKEADSWAKAIGGVVVDVSCVKEQREMKKEAERG